MGSTFHHGIDFAGEPDGAPGSTARAACRHDVQFYFDDQFLIRSLAQYFREALQRGSAAIVVANQAHRNGLAKELERLGIDLTAAIEQGRYVALDAATTLQQFMRDGRLDESLFREVIGKVINCASAAGVHGEKVAILGEIVAILWQRGDTQAALELEQFWNRLSEQHSLQLLCAYPIASFDHEAHVDMFLKICAEHEQVIPAEGYDSFAGENQQLRIIAKLQQTEQALKTEALERRAAQAQAREVRSRNEQLLEEIDKRETMEGELRRFTRRLLTTRDEEQRRIAAELHENTAQLLAALSLYFGVMHEEKASLNPRVASVVASSRSVSENLLNAIRKLSHLLHPPTLDDMGLGSALNEYVEQFRTTSGTKVELRISPELGRFERSLEITVFRIVEEALSNLFLHSRRALATVRLNRWENALILEIQSHQSASSPGDSVTRTESRITGIHERVMEHGGTVQFTSNRSGSLVSITLPLATGTES